MSQEGAASAAPLETLYRLLAESLQRQATLLLDPQGRILTFPPAAERLSGFSAAEAIGRSYEEFCTPEQAGSGGSGVCLETAAREGRWEEVCLRVRRDGGRYWAAVTLLSLRDETGTLRGFAELCRDITAERREAEAERAERILAEALREAAISLSSTLELDEVLDRILAEAGRVVESDAASVLLLGRAGGRAIRTRGGVDPRAVRSHVGAPIRLQGRTIGFLSLDTARPEAYGESDAKSLQAFASQAAVAIQNAELYAEIQRQTAELEVRVRERTRELEAARQAAEAASAAKSEFLANMSHELRTPLNAVLGFAQLLLEQTREILSERQRRHLELIHQSGRHLLGLIEQVLDLARVETGQLRLEIRPTDAARVAQEALAGIREAAAAKGLGLEADLSADLPAVQADPARLRQILDHLLDNAVKFTPAGGRIRVAARRISNFQFPISNLMNGDSESKSQIANRKSEMAEFLEIAVVDTGIGLDAEGLSRLFQPFDQLEAAETKQHAGTGLGLALVRRLAELHGWRVTAASAGPGQGSAFTLRLPVGPLPGEQGQGAGHA